MPISTRLCFRRPPVGPAFAALALLLALAAPALAARSAVVLAYQGFGGSASAATRVSIEQFDAHIAEIAGGGANVLPVADILDALRNDRELPDRTIGISIDGAHVSVYREAWPRLRAAGLPVTLFFATDRLDEKGGGRMSWEQVRELVEGGATIGGRGAGYLNMPLASRTSIEQDIVRAQERFRKEIGRTPTLFAYPRGEMSRAARDATTAHGFSAAFGQQSGVLHSEEDFHFLPRFTIAGRYATLDRFRLAVSALPLRVRNVLPTDRLLRPRDNPPLYGFTVYGDALARIHALSCYASGQGRARIERLGEARIEVRLPGPLPPGAVRVNCTIPGKGGRWRWYGNLFYVFGG